MSSEIGAHTKPSHAADSIGTPPGWNTRVHSGMHACGQGQYTVSVSDRINAMNMTIHSTCEYLSWRVLVICKRVISQ